MPRVHVTSEIGTLRDVLVHTPGNELVAVTPGNREDYLYDDIIDLDLAQREHRRLVAVLERFAEYWERDKVFFDQIVFKIIVDPSVRLANLQAGELDLFERVRPTDLTVGRLTIEKVINGDGKTVGHGDHRLLMTAVTLESAVAGGEGGVRRANRR